MMRAHEVRCQIDLLLRKQGVDTEVSCSTGKDDEDEEQQQEEDGDEASIRGSTLCAQGVKLVKTSNMVLKADGSP
jgi:hypothetical protein